MSIIEPLFFYFALTSNQRGTLLTFEGFPDSVVVASKCRLG